jgi:quercetin dioxygenase-like cupin family protein
MELIDFSSTKADPIERFESVSASRVVIGGTSNGSRIYCLYFGPDGIIGAHPTGFCQFFLVVEGSGWVSGADGNRIALKAGQGMRLEKGEMHSKGSDTGMTAIMIQMVETGDEK